MSPEALEPVLGKAMRRRASPSSPTRRRRSKNTDWDLEAFQNEDFGANLMERLADCMGGEGEYAVFVGSLTSQTHNQWVDGAIAYQKEKYPNMKLVGDKNETFDDQQNAYAKAQEVLRAFPNVKGFQGSASTDVAGIGLADRGARARGQDLRDRHLAALDRRAVPRDRRRRRRSASGIPRSPATR